MRVIHFLAKHSGYKYQYAHAVPFDLLVEEDQFSSFCQYVKENYPEIRCDDSKLADELRQLIEKRIREFSKSYPDYTKDEIRFDVNSIVKITFLDEHMSVDEDQPREITETHEGTLQYEGRQFAFKQKIVYLKETIYSRVVSTSSVYACLLPEKQFHGNSIGSDLVYACDDALRLESKAREKEDYYAQLSSWRQYYNANQKAFQEWFSPLIEANKLGKNCKVFISEIRSSSALSKWDIHNLEHGRCRFCESGCQIVADPYPDKEHAPQWTELGVEEKCPELPLRIMYWRLR